LGSQHQAPVRRRESPSRRIGRTLQLLVGRHSDIVMHFGGSSETDFDKCRPSSCRASAREFQSFDTLSSSRPERSTASRSSADWRELDLGLP
jgi:hypothetical protein